MKWNNWDRLAVVFVGILIIYVALFAGSNASAQTLEYDFRPHQIQRVIPGSTPGATGNAWAPVPNSKTAMVQYMSRTNTGARVFAQKAVNVGAPVIAAAAKTRLLGPVGLGVSAALLAADIVFDEDTEEFVGGDADVDLITSDTVTCVPVSSRIGGSDQFNMSPQACVTYLSTQLAQNTNDDYNGPYRLVPNTQNNQTIFACTDTIFGSGNVDCGYIQGSPDFNLSVINNDLDDNTYEAGFNPYVPPVANDEAVYDALETAFVDGSSSAPGSWREFFTDPVTGAPLNIDNTTFDWDTTTINNEYNDFITNENPTSGETPADTADTAWQQDEGFDAVTETSSEDQGEGESMSEFCQQNPYVISCFQGATVTASQINSSLDGAVDGQIPSEEVALDYQPVDVPDNESGCPADPSFVFQGETIDMSMEPICNTATAFKPFIILSASLMGVGILMGVGERRVK